MSEFIFGGNRLVPTNISKLREFSLKARPDTLNLGLGKPFMDTPPELKKIAKEIMDKMPLDYSENAGTISLREAIASKFNLPVGAVCVTQGAQEALMCTMMGLLNPGDEVLISNPGFVAYKTMIEMIGGVATSYDLDFKHEEFHYNLDELFSKLTDKTKMVIVGRMSNPTASDLTPVQLITLSMELRKRNIVLVCDEVYGELHFQEFYQPGTVLGDNIISINSLSKSHALTGWRIGYVLCRMEPLMKKIIVAHQYIGTCATRISQNLAEKVFLNSDLYMSIVQFFKQHYSESFNLFITGSGMKIPKPQGSFYLFPRIPDNFKNDYAFAEDILTRHNVLVIPGSVFGSAGTRHVRLALSLEHSKIKKVAEIFKIYY